MVRKRPQVKHILDDSKWYRQVLIMCVHCEQPHHHKRICVFRNMSQMHSSVLLRCLFQVGSFIEYAFHSAFFPSTFLIFIDKFRIRCRHAYLQCVQKGAHSYNFSIDIPFSQMWFFPLLIEISQFFEQREQQLQRCKTLTRIPYCRQFHSIRFNVIFACASEFFLLIRLLSFHSRRASVSSLHIILIFHLARVCVTVCHLCHQRFSNSIFITFSCRVLCICKRALAPNAFDCYMAFIWLTAFDCIMHTKWWW